MRILSRDTWIGLVMMGAAALYWFEADKIKVSPLDDGIGAAGLPKALAYALAALAALLILRAVALSFMQGKPAEAEAGAEGPSLGEQLRPHLRAAGMLVIGVGYLLIVNWVGYILAIMALLLAVALYIGAERRPKVLLIAVLGGVFYHFLFVEFLGIPLPEGLLAPVLDMVRGS